jgi:hypothetical protein
MFVIYSCKLDDEIFIVSKELEEKLLKDLFNNQTGRNPEEWDRIESDFFHADIKGKDDIETSID